MMKFKVEWLEGYDNVDSKICTMDDFVSEEFNLDSYWGDDGMIEKLRELLKSKKGEKIQISGNGESVIVTKINTLLRFCNFLIQNILFLGVRRVWYSSCII